MKILKKEIFIYPTDYTQKLEKVKEIIQKIENEKKIEDDIRISYIMQKEKEESIYLISELKRLLIKY